MQAAAQGCASRRRERRLRSHLRHERMAVAMALAESTHHSEQRPKKARAGGEVRGEVPKAHLPQGGSRPPCLGEPRGPQVGILRHNMLQRADVCPFVQILDAPVPQTVEQLPDVLRFLDRLTTVPEQVIAVPKIFPESAPMRAVLRDRNWQNSWWKCRRSYPILGCSYGWGRTLTFQFLVVVGGVLVVEVPKISQDFILQRSVEFAPQMAEQLVEAPTVLSPSPLQQRFAEQVVHNPVPRDRGRRLQGLLPGQSSSPSAEQTVDIPIPRRGGSGGGGLYGFLPEQNSTASVAQQLVDNLQGLHPRQGSQRTDEQIVDIPVPGGGPHPDPGSAASSAVLREEAGQVVCRTFPVGKKCADRPAGGCEHAPARQLVNAGGLRGG